MISHKSAFAIETVLSVQHFFLFVCRIAGHPLAQNERCLHMFLQEEGIDRNYIPGKVRH